MLLTGVCRGGSAHAARRAQGGCRFPGGGGGGGVRGRRGRGWVRAGSVGAVVLFGLTLLLYVTKIAGAIINRKKSAEPAAAPAAAPAAPAVKTAPAPGTAGKIALHDVPDKTAAMLMAIVASKTGKPLNQLRFISIREIKD